MCLSASGCHRNRIVATAAVFNFKTRALKMFASNKDDSLSYLGKSSSLIRR